jgi:hypothetical protein
MHSENINNLSYYYFPKHKKNHCFLSKTSLDEIAQKNSHQIQFQLIKIMPKLLLGKNSKFIFFFYFGPKAHFPLHATLGPRPTRDRVHPALSRGPNCAARGPAAKLVP